MATYSFCGGVNGASASHRGMTLALQLETTQFRRGQPVFGVEFHSAEEMQKVARLLNARCGAAFYKSGEIQGLLRCMLKEVRAPS